MRAVALVWKRTGSPRARRPESWGSGPVRFGAGVWAVVLALISTTASVGSALTVDAGPPASPPSEPPERSVPAGTPATAPAPGAGWFNATDGDQPSARYGAAMGYDDALHAVLAVDGFAFASHPSVRNDTWEYSQGLWSDLSASVGPLPPAVGGASLTYDAVDGYMVLIGGYDALSHRQYDVWAFRDSRWTKITELPQGLQNQSVSAVYDSSDGYVLVLGCGFFSYPPVYSWTGVSWSFRGDVRGPNDCTGTMIDDPSLHGVLLFAGHNSSSGPAPTTWLYSAGNWTNLSSAYGTLPGSRDPAGLEGGAGCFDLQTHQAILVLGGEVAPATPFTYALNENWTNLSSAPSPSAILHPGFAFDPPTDECVLENGYGGSTWAWSAGPAITNLTVFATPDPVDTNVTLVFNATWTGGIAPFRPTWEFGDGSASSSNASHAYGAIGSYVVNLTLVDIANHSATASVTVDVVSTPITPAYAVPDPTDAGVVAHFYPGSAGSTAPTVWSWSFGDGAMSGTSTTYHTYSSPGNFTVTVMLYDNRGRWYNESFVELVHPRLAVTVLTNVVDPARDQSVTLSADVFGGTAPYQYRWSFGDGTGGGNAPNATHAYTANGPFTPTVNVTDALGQTASAARQLALLLNLTIVANWSLGAVGLSVGFTSTVFGGVAPYSYLWEFGDGGTDRSADPSHTYEAAGNYTARLTVVDANGSGIASTWPVTVASGTGPLRASLAAFPSEVPQGASTILVAWVEGGWGGYLVSWDGGGLNCATGSLLNLTCSADGPGTYVVTVRVTDQRGATANATASIVFGPTAVVVVPNPPSLGIPGPGPPRAWEVAAFVIVTLLFGTFVALSVVSAIGAVAALGQRRRRPPRGADPDAPPAELSEE